MFRSKDRLRWIVWNNKLGNPVVSRDLAEQSHLAVEGLDGFPFECSLDKWILQVCMKTHAQTSVPLSSFVAGASFREFAESHKKLYPSGP